MLVGFFYFTSMTRLQTLVQQTAAESKRARVMSLFALAWGGVVWIGTLLLGASADLAGLGVRRTLVAAAAVMIAHGSLVAMRWRGREAARDERSGEENVLARLGEGARDERPNSESAYEPHGVRRTSSE